MDTKRKRHQSISGKLCELLWCFSIYFKLLHMRYQKISGQWTTDKSTLGSVLLTTFCAWLDLHYKQHCISCIEYIIFCDGVIVNKELRSTYI
jgi:hypothetical protein